VDGVTPGLREYKQATLRVAVPIGVPEHMRHGMREIISIHATNPRKGHATHLMHDVCLEADRLGFVLLLQVRPFDDGMTEEQLMKWYGRFGFEQIQPDPVLMARQPRNTIQ
jgi:hypothetical protein